jgi:hypothetical protein
MDLWHKHQSRKLKRVSGDFMRDNPNKLSLKKYVNNAFGYRGRLKTPIVIDIPHS